MARYLRVRVGSSSIQSGGQTYRVRKAIVHPEYTKKPKMHEYDCDIAIVELRKSVRCDENCRRVPLMRTSQDIVDGAAMLVTGWGTDYNQEDNTLRLIYVPKVAEGSCFESYLHFGAVTTRMICAGKGDRDACRGTNFYLFIFF